MTKRKISNQKRRNPPPPMMSLSHSYFFKSITLQVSTLIKL